MTGGLYRDGEKTAENEGDTEEVFDSDDEDSEFICLCQSVTQFFNTGAQTAYQKHLLKLQHMLTVSVRSILLTPFVTHTLCNSDDLLAGTAIIQYLTCASSQPAINPDISFNISQL